MSSCGVHLIFDISVLQLLLFLYGDAVQLPEEKVCYETTGLASAPKDMELHYRQLRDRYNDCTYVYGNLELTWLDEKKDLSFLHRIHEVTGYVLISYVNVDRITFPRLQIIHGKVLFKLPSRKEKCSLVMTDSKTKNLEMPALRAIQTGNVLFFNNSNLCHVDTIKWENIITSFKKDSVSISNPTPVSANCPACHPACEKSCWGEGVDHCQTIPKFKCNRLCSQARCFGTKPDECCHVFCAGGCIGPGPSKCESCNLVNDDGICRVDCPEGKLQYGPVCVKNCPDGWLKYRNSCEKSCPSGRRVLNGECVPCTGTC